MLIRPSTTSGMMAGGRRAGVYPWTGIEKVLWLASRLGSWRFDLVGIAPEELSPMAVPANVTAHGVLARSEYEPLMARADVGLGTLSLYEKEMNELDPLKTREYLARGLPFISGHRDPDIPDGFAYALRRRIRLATCTRTWMRLSRSSRR
jgi:hypothetical protein